MAALTSVDRSAVCRWLAIGLLLLAALRAGVLVSESPIVAYANQFDQARTADCAGLWPADDAGRPFSEATPAAPRSRFVRADLNTAACLPSSAVAAARAAYSVYALAGAFGWDTRPEMDIRYLGGLYAAILIALVTWNHRRLPSGGVRCLHALAVLLLLADPFVTLFFNTLYTEAPAVIGCYAAVSILLRPHPPLTRADVVVFVLALAVLGTARPAHFGLPLLLSLLLAWRWLAIERTGLRTLALPLVCALAIAVWQLHFNASHWTLRFANRTNSIMEALAPNAGQPGHFLADLGLPASCEPLLGTNWYDRYGHDPVAECPMLGSVPTWRVAAVGAGHPESVLRALYRAQFQAGAWRLPYVGEIEGRRYETAAQRWPLAGFSLADLWPLVPFGGRLAFFGVPVLLALSAIRRPRSLQSLAFLAAGLTVVAVWTVSVVGDGYGELGRHAQLAFVAGLWSWGLLLVRVLCAPDWPARAAWAAVPALGALIGVGVAGAAPLALGYVESYDGRTAKGWVIASRPMRGVDLSIGGAPAAITLDDARTSADVARYFALPVGTQAQRWHADIPGGDRCRPARLDVRLGPRPEDTLPALEFALGPAAAIGTGREPRCAGPERSARRSGDIGRATRHAPDG